jgi:hypothetical protein
MLIADWWVAELVWILREMNHDFSVIQLVA